MALSEHKRVQVNKWFDCCDYLYNPANSIWEHTCQILKDDILSLPEFENEKEVSSYLHDIFYQYLNQAGLPVPENGIGRSGKEIIIRDKKTEEIKWSSWAITFKGLRYLGDIAKISFRLGGKHIFNEKGLTYPRIKLLELAKSK